MRRPGATDEAFPLDQIDPLALSQLGFVVWVVDGRGTQERGRAFRDVAHGGSFDGIRDHVAALRQVAALVVASPADAVHLLSKVDDLEICGKRSRKLGRFAGLEPGQQRPELVVSRAVAFAPADCRVAH